MGKWRRNKVHEEQGESMTMKERIATRLEESNDNNTAKVRAKALDSWMEICGVDRVEDIDYSNPRVHLEWFLCDFRMLAKLTSGKREEVLELMDDQQR